MPELAISAEKVGFLIEKAREFDVKDVASDPDSGSNGADDDMVDVLEDNGNDAVVREITGFIDALTVDEQIDLVALMRLGRSERTVMHRSIRSRIGITGLRLRLVAYTAIVEFIAISLRVVAILPPKSTSTTRSTPRPSVNAVALATTSSVL